MKKLTIITINYNNKEGLEKTLESIDCQSFKDFELIVVDGGSSDGSVEVIKKYETIVTHWVSEPDGGIYNAMNKGARMATSEYLTYVNSGDCLYDESVLSDIMEHLDGHCDIVWGNVINVMPNGVRGRYYITHEISMMSLYRDVVNHAGAFIKRLQQLKRPYNEELKICSDRQFFIESLILDNCNYKKINRDVVLFDKSGISSSPEGDILMNEENERILDLTLPPRIASDYRKSNLHLQDLTSELSQYHGFGKAICRLDKILINIYKIIKKRK